MEYYAQTDERREERREGVLSKLWQDEKSRRRLILALVVAGLFAALWIWKAIQLNRIGKEAAHERQQLHHAARQAVIQAHQQHLRALAAPMSWVLRNEMMNDNVGAVHRYANNLIRQRNFQSIIVADVQGRIISSTNKKWEGKAFSQVGRPAYLSADSTIVETVMDSTVIVASPIMGLNSRLGTLMIVYAVPPVLL